MSVKTTIPEVPMHLDVQTRRFLTAVRNNLHHLLAGMVPAQPVSNLSAEPLPGGCLIRFTRGDADYYVLYAGNTGNVGEAQTIDLGNTNSYNDLVGSGGVKRYYWIRAKKHGTADSILVGPVSATSLAPSATTSVPIAPPPAVINVTDQATGHPTPVNTSGGTPRTDL